MSQQRTWQETVKVQGDQLVEQVKRLIHEGNVRRVVVKQGDRTIAEFPLTIGVVGAALAPPLAAIGALAALVTNCSVELERVGEGEQPAAGTAEAIGPGGESASSGDGPPPSLPA